MKRRIALLYIVAFIFTQSNYAQEILLPYLSGNRYGLADASGRLVVQPEYDAVKPYADKPLLAVQKDGLWGIVNLKGEVLLPPVVKGRRSVRDNSPSIGLALHPGIYDLENHPVYRPHLYIISDEASKERYYINPYAPSDQYQPFLPPDVVRMDSRSSFYPTAFKTGILKVGTADQKINFIDTTGQVLFPEGVHDGYALSDYFIAIEDGQGRFALFNKANQQLSAFDYSRFEIAGDDNFVLAEKRVGAGPNLTTYYALLGKDGQALFLDVPSLKALEEGRVLVNDGQSARLYDYSGQLIASFEDSQLFTLSHTPGQYLLKNEAGYGIVDPAGQILLNPQYGSLNELRNGQFIFQKGVQSGLLSAEFQELFTLDSVTIHTVYASYTEYYEIRKRDRNYRALRGVIDSLGRVIVEPVFDKVIYDDKCRSLFLVQQDSLKGVVNGDGKMILPLANAETAISCRQEEIRRAINGEVMRYALSGEELGPLNTDKPWLRIITKSGVSHLVDQYDQELTAPIYRQIFSNEDAKAGRLIYFGRKLDKSDPFVDVINDYGREITPEGFGLPENFTHSRTGENGAIVVVHKGDVLSRKMPFRSGVINFEGEWIVPPDYQVTTIVGNELIRTTNSVNGTAALYSRYGETLSEKPYEYFERDPNDRIHNDRLVVGYLTNREEYLRSVAPIYEADFDKTAPETMLKKLEQVAEPSYRLGYINTKGEEVIPPQFMLAAPFQHQYTTVTGIDQNGDIYSSVIGLDGQTLLRTPYERLDIMYRDSTLLQARQNGKWGVIGLDGKVIIEPQFEKINLTEVPGIFFAVDSVFSYLLTQDNRRSPIGPVAGSMDIEKLNGSYFSTRLRARADGKYQTFIHVFDNQGNHYGDYSGFQTSPDFLGEMLPEGFMAVQKDKQAKPYVVWIETGLEFRE